MEPTLIVGIGSPLGDDQAGWRLAQCVADKEGAEIAARNFRLLLAKSPADILDCLEGVQRLMIFDGCRGLGRPGEFRRFDWPTAQIPMMRGGGSHDFSLTAVLELAARLRRLPATVVIWAIEVNGTAVGQPLSGELARAIPVLAAAARAELLENCSAVKALGPAADPGEMCLSGTKPAICPQ